MMTYFVLPIPLFGGGLCSESPNDTNWQEFYQKNGIEYARSAISPNIVLVKNTGSSDANKLAKYLYDNYQGLKLIVYLPLPNTTAAYASPDSPFDSFLTENFGMSELTHPDLSHSIIVGPGDLINLEIKSLSLLHELDHAAIGAGVYSQGRNFMNSSAGVNLKADEPISLEENQVTYADLVRTARALKSRGDLEPVLRQASRHKVDQFLNENYVNSRTKTLESASTIELFSRFINRLINLEENAHQNNVAFTHFQNNIFNLPFEIVKDPVSKVLNRWYRVEVIGGNSEKLRHIFVLPQSNTGVIELTEIGKIDLFLKLAMRIGKLSHTFLENWESLPNTVDTLRKMIVTITDSHPRVFENLQNSEMQRMKTKISEFEKVN